MGLLEVFSWIYISYLCDVVVRRIVGAFKCNGPKAIEQPVEAFNVSLDGESNPAPVKEDDVKQEETSTSKNCPFLSRISDALFGKSTDLSEVHSEELERARYIPDWKKDPVVARAGLARIDTLSNDGKTEITSYYNTIGKLVYQKQQPVAQNDLNTQQQPEREVSLIRPTDDSMDKQFKEMFNFDDTMEHAVDDTFKQLMFNH